MSCGCWAAPGTGKTSALIETAAAHIAAGADPESVLLLTGSARLGSAGARRHHRGAAARRAAAPAVREPLVRTVHSYAFAVLRLAAQRNGDPPPRLITSAEQDGIIRELLAGDLEDGDDAPVAWPAQLRPALSTVGFATELRDLLARCTERGVDPVALQRIGRRAGRPEWVAAGQFAQDYEQVMLLRSAVGHGRAAGHRARARRRRTRRRRAGGVRRPTPTCWPPNAHGSSCCSSTTPSTSTLRPPGWCGSLAAGAELTVIAGDPNQSVFGYRGADPAPVGAATTTGHRAHGVAPLRTRRRAGRHRQSRGGCPVPARPVNWSARASSPGSMSVRIAASPHAEAALIADTLRRAHLVDGVPWSQMAVVVRSVPRRARRWPER